MNQKIISSSHGKEFQTTRDIRFVRMGPLIVLRLAEQQHVKDGAFQALMSWAIAAITTAY